MVAVIFEMSDKQRHEIWGHLFRNQGLREEAGFALAKYYQSGDQCTFHFVHWLPLYEHDYEQQRGDYLELSDATRRFLIKAAHDHKASLVEFHSHPGPYPAMFSWADKIGFEEFVPHVWWRLKAAPFLAVVVAASGFDSLAWIDSQTNPAPLSLIKTENENLSPTGLTLDSWKNRYA